MTTAPVFARSASDEATWRRGFYLQVGAVTMAQHGDAILGDDLPPVSPSLQLGRGKLIKKEGLPPLLNTPAEAAVIPTSLSREWPFSSFPYRAGWV